MNTKKEEKRRGGSQGTPLEELHHGLTPRQLQRFEALWIVTAEELLSMSAIAEDRQRLATYLGMSLMEFEALLADVRVQLKPEVVEKMESRVTKQPSEQRDGKPNRRPKGKKNDKMKTRGTALEELRPQPLSPEHLRSLRKLGVTTAEELISMSALSGTRRRLATYLHMSQVEFEAVLVEVRAQLEPEVVEDMERPVRGGHRRGVLDPIPEEKRRGRWPASEKANAEDEVP